MLSSVNAIRNAECPEDMAGAPAAAPVSAAAAAELFAQAEAVEQANPPATVGSVASEIIFEADIHAIAEGTAARVEFELGFAEEMARSLGDGEPTCIAQSLSEPLALTRWLCDRHHGRARACAHGRDQRMLGGVRGGSRSHVRRIQRG